MSKAKAKAIKFKNKAEAAEILTKNKIEFPVYRESSKNAGKPNENLATLQERYDCVVQGREFKGPVKGPVPASLDKNNNGMPDVGEKPVFHRKPKLRRRNPMGF